MSDEKRKSIRGALMGSSTLHAGALGQLLRPAHHHHHHHHDGCCGHDHAHQHDEGCDHDHAPGESCRADK